MNVRERKREGGFGFGFSMDEGRKEGLDEREMMSGQ